MPITRTYGPITAALQLAQQAGEGESFMRRHQIGQEAIRNIQVETGQALQLRGQQAQEAQAIQQAGAQQQRFAAEQQVMQFNQEMKFKEADLAERRQGLYEQKQMQAELWAPKKFELEEMRAEAYSKSVGGGFNIKKNPQYIAGLESLKLINTNVKMITDQIKSITSSVTGRPGKGNEDRYDRLTRQLDEQAKSGSMQRLKLQDMIMASPANQGRQMGGAPARQQLPPTGGVRPQSVTIMAGRVAIQLPAPPQQLTAPAPGTPLNMYPQANQGLQGIYWQSVQERFTTGGIQANKVTIEEGYDRYAEAQGWSAN